MAGKSFRSDIYIYGPTGNGKTHLAASIINHRLWEGRTQHAFIKATRLILDIKSAIANNDTDVVINKHKAGHLLIIDDVGVENLGEYVMECWYEILDYRYCWAYPTIITSNLTPVELANKYGMRLASRILSGKRIKLTGPDYRLKGQE